MSIDWFGMFLFNKDVTMQSKFEKPRKNQNASTRDNRSVFFQGTESDSLKNIKGTCLTCTTSQFQPMQVDIQTEALCFKFYISHHIPNDHFLDIVDGIPPEDFVHHVEKERMIHSSLKFKFTRTEGRLFLKLECSTYPDVYNYQLNELLATFVKPIPNKSILRIADELKKVQIGKLQVPVRTVSTYDDFDFDDVNMSQIMEHVSDFQINCLKRFEELTLNRDEGATGNSIALGLLLDAMTENYKKVSQKQYELALEKLELIENHETYKNDPLIYFSLTPIKDAINTLRQRALASGRGAEIDEHQMNAFLYELVKHEGLKPEQGAWFGIGDVEQLKYQLETFLKLEQRVFDTGVWSAVASYC